MTESEIWPKLAVASALVLLASSMVAGGVFAATPTIAWGSLAPDTVTTGAQPALVSAGRTASFTVSLRNEDTATISQLYLKAVTQAAQPAPEVTGLYYVSSSPEHLHAAVVEANHVELLIPRCEATRCGHRAGRLYGAAWD